MTYKSLHFDNEVINALYSVDSIRYWKHYTHKFYNEWNELDFRLVNQSYDSPFKAIISKDMAAIVSDLKQLANDLSFVNHKDPIVTSIAKTVEDIEVLILVETLDDLK